jgi:lipopolysaccharide export system permease protein
MKLPITLSFYIAKAFTLYLLLVIFCFATLIVTVDAIELLRKLAGREIEFFRIIEMSLLKFPIFLQDVMPFIVLVASVLTYSKLAKTNELVIIRSAGISALEFMVPCILTGFLFGILAIVLLNPIATSMANRFDVLKSKYILNSKETIEISDSGFWVKQKINENPSDNNTQNNIQNSEGKIFETIIHSSTINSNETADKKTNITLSSAVILNFDDKGRFINRIDADLILLRENNWFLPSAVITDNQAKITPITNYNIATKVKAADLQKSLSDAETVSFWSLPKFIKKLQDNGFSAANHILQFNKILSMPFFFAAMVLIGAIFTLKSPRISKSGASIAFAILLGFLIYFFSNLVFSLGLSGSIPIVFSAWVPIMIIGLSGIYLMLHLEDG